MLFLFVFYLSGCLLLFSYMEVRILGIHHKQILIAPFFMNSIPKSGTNLLFNILLRLPNIKRSSIISLFEGNPNQFMNHFYRLGHMQPNAFGIGHVYYSPQWSYFLTRLKIKQIFITRDLRDIVISYSHFLAKHNHLPEYPLFHHQLRTNKQRYLALIRGFHLNKKGRRPDIGTWFRQFQGWFQDRNTLSITYEDLVRSKESRHHTCRRILEFLLEDQLKPDVMTQWITLMEQGMNPKLSWTYRSGKIGNWKSEFDQEVKNLFKSKAGQILIQTGYEKDLNW